MYTAWRRVLPVLFAALMLLAAHPALAANPAVKPGSPLALALSDEAVVKALHKLTAREGLAVTRISQRAAPPAVVLTFHARPAEGGVEAPRLSVSIDGRAVRLLEAK